MNQEIQINDRVAYVPMHACGDLNHPDVERGRVSSRNDKFIFVKFDGKHPDAPGIACDPVDLVLESQT